MRTMRTGYVSPDLNDKFRNYVWNELSSWIRSRNAQAPMSKIQKAARAPHRLYVEHNVGSRNHNVTRILNKSLAARQTASDETRSS